MFVEQGGCWAAWNLCFPMSQLDWTDNLVLPVVGRFGGFWWIGLG
jgi:hypothetical protein